jgi:hypothetical protein
MIFAGILNGVTSRVALLFGLLIGQGGRQADRRRGSSPSRHQKYLHRAVTLLCSALQLFF